MWTGNEGRLGHLNPDIQIPGYLEYADRESRSLVFIPGPEWLTRRSWRKTCSKSSRTEPIFHSLDSPADMYGVELITDRNSLRKIYGLYTPDAIYGKKAFRIDAQKIGNVVIFSRWEDPEATRPKAPHPFCFSKSPELVTIEQQLEGAVSCHRLVRYEFGGIAMMVRFELDAVSEAAPRNDSSQAINGRVDSSAEAMQKQSYLPSYLFPNIRWRPLRSLESVRSSGKEREVLSRFGKAKSRLG